MTDVDGQTRIPPIAIISHAHPSVSKGGAELAAYTLFRGLQQIGAPVHFIATVPYKDRARLDLGRDEYAVYVQNERYDYFNHLSDPEVSIKIRKIITDLGSKIINFHHFLNIGLNTLRDVSSMPGRQSILTLHEFLSICHHHGQMITRPSFALCSTPSFTDCGSCFPELGWRRFELRKAHVQANLEKFAQFVSPSHFLAARMQAWGLPAQRMHVIENGLANLPSQSTIHRDPEKKAWVFGYFGQVNPFKGVEVLLRAAKEIASEGLTTSIEIRNSRQYRRPIRGFPGRDGASHGRASVSEIQWAL